MGEDDRRRFRRKKKQSVISFHIIEEGEDGRNCKAVVVDGSREGVRFRTGQPLAKNTKIYIKLESEDWGEELTYVCKKDGVDLAEVIGSVIWCLENESNPGEFEIGARFISKVVQ